MTSSTRKWCIQFVRCKGCKLDSECAVRVSDGHPYIRDGVIIDPWAIRTTAMIDRELSTMQSIEN